MPVAGALAAGDAVVAGVALSSGVVEQNGETWVMGPINQTGFAAILVACSVENFHSLHRSPSGLKKTRCCDAAGRCSASIQ